jgi:hypothetical protein
MSNWKLFWYSSDRGETDVSLDSGGFYGPFVSPRMRMSEGVMNEWMNERNIFLIFVKVEPTVEWYWGVKPKDSEKNQSQCHFVHHKSHWIDLGANQGRRGERPATNHLSHVMANYWTKSPIQA